MKVVELGGKQIVLTDEQVEAMKTLALPILNLLLAMGGTLITPEHPNYEKIKKLILGKE